MAKVLVAMSGGVDSSVAAALLLEQGHEVVGCMGIMHGGAAGADAGADAAGADVQAARDVAARLGIPFHVLDLRACFERHVMQPFCADYGAGITPSPCIECNRFVKFGALQDEMRRLNCEFLATGHYARIVAASTPDGAVELHKAACAEKDQSYMLAALSQRQLAHTLLPLGERSKGEVRAKARELGFANAERAESQDICFVEGGDYVRFIEERSRCGDGGNGRDGLKPGAFIDDSGRVLGEHRGIARYTIGQRKGIGLAFGEPRYVCALDAEANTVTIGTADELLRCEVRLLDASWIAGAPPKAAGGAAAGAGGFPCRAKLRYRQTEQPARAHALPDGGILLVFDEPQRAVAPGQYAVLYDGTRVVASGRIGR